MWVAALAIVRFGPAVGKWQSSQRVSLGWGAPGGLPWQEPQEAWLPSTRVHCGIVTAPSGRVMPWQ